MDERITSQAYETPRVVDYGDLQELTAACLGGPGADGVLPGNSGNTFGSSPAVGHGPGCVNGH
jgi:hypothetical protein